MARTRYNLPAAMANRYFVDDLPGPGPTTLDGPLGHHLATVLRLGVGETFVLGDGRGRSARALATAVRKGRVDCDVAPSELHAPPSHRLQLLFAPPKQSRAEWLFEHGTEVGVAVFRPIWTERTRPQGDRLARWQKIAAAAAGQCDRAFLPELLPPVELAAALLDPELPARRFVGALGAPPFDSNDTAKGDAVLLVGPEGGFSEREQTAIAAAGFAPRAFGPHVLRTETAAIVGAALWLASSVG